VYACAHLPNSVTTHRANNDQRRALAFYSHVLGKRSSSELNSQTAGYDLQGEEELLLGDPGVGKGEEKGEREGGFHWVEPELSALSGSPKDDFPVQKMITFTGTWNRG
jgi:hypothetical protein